MLLLCFVVVVFREDLQHHYNYYKKPYRGELGLGSYQPSQIQDYFLVTVQALTLILYLALYL